MAYMVDENGNYKRSVRCSHCYEVGHNKNSCPARLESLKNNKAEYEKQLAAGISDEWDRNWTERRLRDTQHSLDKMLNKGKGRTCTYCGETGHNRRGCTKRKAKGKEITEKLLRLRRHALDTVATMGLGPGALVQWTSMIDQPQEKTHLAIVEKIHWDRIKYDSAPNEMHTGEKAYRFSAPQAIEVKLTQPIKDSWRGNLERVFLPIPICAINPEELEITRLRQQDNGRDHRFVLVGPTDVDQYFQESRTDAFSEKVALKEAFAIIDDK